MQAGWIRVLFESFRLFEYAQRYNLLSTSIPETFQEFNFGVE
jgi:hypothetical protein